MNDNARKLYDALSQEYDLGTFEQFNSDIQDESKRRKLYDATINEYNFGEYDSFNKQLGFGGESMAVAQPKAEPEINGSAWDAYKNVGHVGDIAPEKETLTTFGEGVKQGADAIYQGSKYAVGEAARYATGKSQMIYDDALAYLDERGDKIDGKNFDWEKAKEDDRYARYEEKMELWRKEKAKRKAEREELGFFEGLKHKWNDPSMPDYKDYKETMGEDIRHGQALYAVKEALEEAGGDKKIARQILEKKASEEQWGDKKMREASEAMAKHKPVEGAAWWGQMVPQVAGQATAIASNLIPGVGGVLGKTLSIGTTVGLTMSSAGQAMAEARAAGASEDEIWATGLMQALIEYGSEKIPLDRLIGKMGSAAFKKGYKAVAGNIPEKELEKLLVEGNKRFGGKLLSGKTAKELIKDMGVEGASEFVAEFLGTYVPVIYADKESYPTLLEAVKNGWEGAKGGFAMGGFLGGGSMALTNRANNKRREMQGGVTLAETKDYGVVEVLRTEDDMTEVLLTDGNTEWVPLNELTKTHTYSIEAWKTGDMNAKAQAAEEVYNEGYNTDEQEWTKVKTAYDFNRAMAEKYLGDVFEQLDKDPIATLQSMQESFPDEDLQIARDYVEAKARFEGVSDNVKDNVEQESQESDKVIQERINKTDGMVYSTTLHGGERVFITGGTVVLDDEGYIDVANSGDLWALYPDGTKKQLREGDLREKVEVFNTDELKATERAVIEELWRDKLNTFSYSDNEGEHVITVKQTNGEISRAVVDGVEQDVPTRFINELKDKIVQKSPAADNTAEVATETPVAGNTQTMIESIPTETRGKVKRTAYHVVPIERTLEDLKSNELTEDEKILFAQANIDEINSELQKVLKQEPKIGADIQAYKAAKAQWTVARDEWQKRLDYYNELLNRLKQPVQTSTATEVAPAVETPQATNKMQPVRKVVSKKRAAPEMPETVEEFVASVMPKITPESFKRETGLSNGEQRQLVGYIAGKGKGGITIEQAAESIVANYNDELLGLGFTGDEQDVRDMIINILSNGNPKGYIKRSRALREAELSQQEREMADVWAEGMGFDSYENYLDYTESLLEDIEEQRNDFDETEYYNNLAENYGYDTTGERKDFGRGGELLQGEQFVTTTPSEVIGEGYEGTAVPGDVRGGGDNALTQGETRQVNTVNNESIAEGGNAPGQSDVIDHYTLNGAGNSTQMQKDMEALRKNNRDEYSKIQPAYELLKQAKERGLYPNELEELRTIVKGTSLESKVDGWFIPVIAEGEKAQAERNITTAEETRRVPLRQRAQEWMQKVGVPVRIIESLDEVTNKDARKALEAGKNISGWIDNNEVVLYLPNIGSVNEIDATYIHEVVAHKGLKFLMKEDFGALCDAVWNAMSEEARAKYINYTGVNGDTRKAAEEYMAHLAEGVNLTEADYSVWQKFVELVKKFISGNLGAKMTDKQIEMLIKASYANLKKAHAETQSELEGTKFRIAQTTQEFDATQKEAVEKRGIVAPNLNSAVVNVVDVPRHDFEGTGSEAINKAKQWAKENLVGEYTANEGTDDEFNYSIDEKSIKKYLSGVSTGLSDNLGVHLSVLKVLPDVINESIEVEVHADYKKGKGRSVDNGIEDENLLIHRLYGAVYINGDLHRVKTTLKERKADGVKPYTYEVTKIELLGGSSQNGTSSSIAPNNSIPVTKLLEGVEKSYDKGKKVLDESENSSAEQENGISFREDDATLIGTHSLTEEKLRKAIKMGGLANPSTAIFEMGEEMPGEYGEITFVMPSSMVDKKTGRNTGAFAGDAWTPTYPQVERQMSKRGGYRAREDVQSVPKEMQKEVRMGLDSWLDGREGAGLAYLFLQEEGLAPELSRVAQRYSDEIRNRVGEIAQGEPFYRLSPEQKQEIVDLFIEQYYNGDRAYYSNYLNEKVVMMREKLADENTKSFIKKSIQQYIDGVNEYGFEYEAVSDFLNKVQRDIDHSGGVNDRATTQEAARVIREKGLEREFQMWKEQLLDRYEIKEVIFKGFTPTGNRRYVPHTLENVSKDMKEQGRNGAVGLNASFNKFAAGLLKPLGSLDAIRKRKGNLRATHADTEAFRDKWSEVYYDLAEKLQPDAKGYEDYGLDRVAEAATKKDPKAFIKSEYGIELSEADEKALKDMIWAIQNEYPVMYFETKFERPVYLDEFAGVALPENVGKDIVEALNNAGMKIETYEPGNEKARMDAVKKLSEGEGIRFREANKNQEIFVSNARKAVEEIKQEKATPQQWLAMIKKNGGLKAGEDKWMGLGEWLEGNESKSLTKQEVLDFVNENAIKIEEVGYNGDTDVYSSHDIYETEEFTDLNSSLIEYDEEENPYINREEYERLRNEDPDFFDGFSIDYWGEGIEVNDPKAAARYLGLAKGRQINSTRLDYTTEGLENKREIALVVPTVEPYNQGDEIHFGDAGEGRAVAWVRFGETTAPVKEYADFYAFQKQMQEKYYPERRVQALNDADLIKLSVEEIREFERLRKAKEQIPFNQSKERVLVIDEIQSKRHQDAREKGYVTEDYIYAKRERDYLYKKMYEKGLTEEEHERYKWLQQYTADNFGIVPEAPFEKNWQELAMKRMLRLAAEEGFDKVAWTTGEQQAERYNLGAVLKGLKAYKTSANEYYVIPYNNGVIGEFVKEYTEQELADTFGKELAQKIITNAENATEENPYEIESEELRVGGEGMKGFYDKMLPSFVSKYTKKWGAKVGYVEMPSLEQNNVMHSVDVTPEMKESVMEGQTMFRENNTRKGWNIENKNITLHKTKDGKVIRYEQLDLFNNDERSNTDIQWNTSEGNGNANDGAGNDNLQRDNLAGGNSIAQINVPLRPLKEGETSLVQRIFTKSKAFDFTAGEQIESLEDVAYIFKNLEDESIENSFAVLVKDGKPVVLHLGMGGYTSTMINTTAVAVAMENIKPDKVYFVHNHPSGALKASANDVAVLQNLRTSYGDIVEKGIIINLKSGKFGVYDVAQATSEVRDEKTGDGLEVPVEIFTFNKQVFDKDFNPSELFQIYNADDIAAFISSNRLGDRNKIGLLVCNNQLKVVGNVFTPYISINSAAAQKIAKDIVYYTTVMGGNRPILFGRFPELSGTAKSNLEFYINSYSGGQIKLVDLVDVESSESVLNEEGAFYGDITKGSAVERVNLREPEGGVLFREGKTATQKEKQAILKENAKAIRRLHNVSASYPITALRNLRHALETEQERLEHDRLFAVRDGLVENANKAVSIEVNPQGMTLQERITESLLELANDNRENVETRLAAIRAYSGSLDNVLKLMRAQRGYDKKTVDMFVGLVKMYLRNNAVKGMSNYDIYRLLGLINRASGGYGIQVNRAAEQIVEIITKGHIRELQETMNRMLKTGAEKVNASGVVVQGGVDIVGKRKLNSFRDAIVMSQEAFEEKMAKIQEKVAKNPEDAEVLAELDAMYLAQQYKEKVADSKADEEELLRQVAADSEMRGLLNRGVISRKTYNEFADGVRRNVIELRTRRIDEMQKILRALAGDISEGMLAAKEFRERELAKRMEIHDIAEADLKGVSKAAFKSQKASKAMDWFVYKNPIVRGVMAGLPTYNNLLSFFGEKTAGMTGNLKEYFLSKYTTAVQEKWKNLQKDKETLEEKTKRITGSSFEELGDLSAKIGATISFWDGEAVRERELSYGQMMYIYMVNKMTDGAMKLRSMGISEEMVNTIEGMLPKKLVKMADWIQGDFLPQMRGRFNVVHQRMFGASMDEVENYFPLVINKGSRRENVDVSSMIPTTPSTITGSIIKRRVNTAAIDINANALDVLMKHLEEMEQWAAFGEFIKDNNILLSDTDFKNRVKNMKSVRYGDGEDILEAFKECAQLATGTHRAKGNELSVNLARGLNSGKIAFGFYTALKQFLSQPAVLADAGVMDVVKAVTSPFEAWEWAAENVPGFEERWKGRTAGIETFEKTDKDWGLWDKKTMKKIRNLGMTPNAWVDAVVVAVNAKAVYDSRMKFYSSIGFDKAVANKRALHDAAVSYNETQQSGLGAFVSPMQADRTFLGMLLTLFRNSQMGYQRRLINAVKGIANRVSVYDELRANTVEKYKKMGLDDKKADEAAQRDMNVSLAKDAMSVVLFGYVLNLLWALGEDAIYLLFGDDEEEKDRVMKENAVVAFSGLFEGLTLGGQAKEVMTRLYRGENVRDLGILTTPLETDWNKVFQKFQNEGWLSGAYQLVMTSTESLTGVSPQRLVDIYAAVVDLCKGDLEMSRRVMLFATRLMMVPQSQIDKVYQDWAMSEDDEELLKMAKRYVDYKMNRENPLDKDNPELRLKKLNRFDEAVMERIAAGVESAQDIELVYDRVSPKYKDKLRRMWNSLTDEEAKDSATVNAELVDDFEKKMRGLVDFKVYDSLETMDDLRDDRFLKEVEAMGMPANTKKKNGGALSDEELRLWRLYKIASKTRNSVNELKRLMDKRPEDAEKAMMRVRMLRAKAMNLIEGYNE